jgi:hypothetical protein
MGGGPDRVLVACPDEVALKIRKAPDTARKLDVKTPFTSKDFKQQRQIASGPTKTVKHLADASFSERAKIGPQVFDDLWVHTGKLAFRLEVLKDLGSKALARLAPRVLTNLAGGEEHP